MAEIYKFFNSAPGDLRQYFASDFANYFSSVLSAGLLLDENEEYGLQVTHESGLQTVVAPGKALIKGYSYENTTPLILTHDLPEMTFDRIDRIVLRLDLRNQHRYIRLFVKAGEASENPVPPDLQRDQFIYELSLAQVRLRANTASIDPTDITDERALEDVCGIVQSLITVPTSVFQQQFEVWFNNRKEVYETQMDNWKNEQQTDFEGWKQQEQADFVAWVQSLREVLDENAAGNLLNLINQNTNEITQVKQEVMSHKADYVKHPAFAVTTGSANAYEVTLNPAPTAYEDGFGIVVAIHADSTGAATLNVNGLGAIPIKKANGNNVTNLKANGVYTLRYSAGNFILQGEGGSGNAQPSDVLSGKTFTNDSGEQVGTMPNRGAMIITPTTTDQPIPAGYHNGSGIVKGDPDLISANIKQGVDIFGVVGSLLPLTNEKKWARGSFTNLQVGNSISVSGLDFTPNFILAANLNNPPDIVIASRNPFYPSNLKRKYMNSGSDPLIYLTWGGNSFTIDAPSPNTSTKWFACE